MNRCRWNICFGMLIVLAIFIIRYETIDPSLYQFRDDGIITLSHAKNWVDHGVIGVNPSGGKVEGTSAPLQFLIYAGTYFFTGMGYQAFNFIQMALCSLLLGLAIMILFQSENKWTWSVGLIFALFLAFQSSFIQWHGSGLENPFTHAFFLLTIAGLCSMLWKKEINYGWVIITFLASISRIDSVFHIFPMLCVFSVLWWFSTKNRSGFIFVGWVMVLWVGLNVLRFLYFGEWLPNTAYAQDISIVSRLKSIIHLNPSSIDQVKFLIKQIYFSHAGHWLLVLIFIPWVDWKKKYSSLIVLSMVPVITALIYPAFFGPARLDYGRTTTHMPLFIFLMVVSIWMSLQKKSFQLAVSTFGIIFGFFIYSKTYTPPYYLCCDINGFEVTHAKFKQIAQNEAITRPTVANPDLGIMSWYKDMNIVDLGMIGTPYLAKTKNPKVISDFIFDQISPDLIESHEAWSCLYYNVIFMDPRFKEKYLAVQEEFVQYGSSCDGKALPVGIWIRKDILKNSNSIERKFYDALKNSSNLAIVADELKSCKEHKNCNYVTRSVYRLLPEIKSRGQYQQLLDVYSSLGVASDFDQYLLSY